MIQCQDCQYFSRSDAGEIAFACDPFATIVEPECLAKWQLIKTNQLGAQMAQMAQQVAQMSAAYQATIQYYQKLAPMQEKMFRFMEREIDDAQEADSWKIDEDDPDQTDSLDDGDEPWRESL